MPFSEQYLRNVVEGKVQGDFYPFTTGSWDRTEDYLKRLVGRLRDIPSIDVNAIFNHYGSGTASYVHLYIARRDKSGTNQMLRGESLPDHTTGVMLYLCRIAPVAVYAAGNWTSTHQNGKWQIVYSHYITPDAVGSLPAGNWKEEMRQINAILNEYGYGFLTRAEVDVPLSFRIKIPTILTDPPYRIFDCFFYWED
jgi:hypothetical protein